MTPHDPTIPYRIVGSYEYLNSINQFNRLVKISTDQEIEVYNKFLVTRPEFTYYNGVNTAFENPPDLKAANPAERAKFNDRFQKGGLEWMLALARAEVGATLSMYSDEDYPFEATIDDEYYGLEPYLDLLTDDVTAHLKALKGEGKFREVLRPRHRVDTWSIAYLRRLKIIKDMLSSIARASSRDRVLEIKPLYDELAEHESQLVGNVMSWLTPGSITTQSTTTDVQSQTQRISANLDECRRVVGRLQGSPTPQVQSSQSGTSGK